MRFIILISSCVVCMKYFRFRTVWPDLAKFHPLGKIAQVLGNILGVNLVLGNIWNLPWQIFHAIGQIFNLLNDQILKK